MGPVSLPVCPPVRRGPLLGSRGPEIGGPQTLVGPPGISGGGALAGAPVDCVGKGPPALLSGHLLLCERKKMTNMNLQMRIMKNHMNDKKVKLTFQEEIMI